METGGTTLWCVERLRGGGKLWLMIGETERR